MSRTITYIQGLTITAIIAAEKHTLVLDYVIFDSQWSVKCRSRALCHGVCLKSMSRTITMQGIILAAITAAEKFT